MRRRALSVQLTRTPIVKPGNQTSMNAAFDAGHALTSCWVYEADGNCSRSRSTKSSRRLGRGPLADRRAWQETSRAVRIQLSRTTRRTRHKAAYLIRQSRTILYLSNPPPVRPSASMHPPALEPQRVLPLFSLTHPPPVQPQTPSQAPTSPPDRGTTPLCHSRSSA